MNTHPHFPIDLTPEEREAGFRLVHAKVQVYGLEVVVAVLELSPSARLVKSLAVPLLPGKGAFGYLLQIFASDTHPFNRDPKPPAWEMVWNRTSSTIRDAVHSFQTEPLHYKWTLVPAPVEPTVTPPKPREPGAPPR